MSVCSGASSLKWLRGNSCVVLNNLWVGRWQTTTSDRSSPVAVYTCIRMSCLNQYLTRANIIYCLKTTHAHTPCVSGLRSWAYAGIYECVNKEHERYIHNLSTAIPFGVVTIVPFVAREDPRWSIPSIQIDLEILRLHASKAARNC